MPRSLMAQASLSLPLPSRRHSGFTLGRSGGGRRDGHTCEAVAHVWKYGAPDAQRIVCMHT
eukprot:363618-Chlamydomonas_euryale.AAC.16